MLIFFKVEIQFLIEYFLEHLILLFDTFYQWVNFLILIFHAWIGLLYPNTFLSNVSSFYLFHFIFWNISFFPFFRVTSTKFKAYLLLFKAWSCLWWRSNWLISRQILFSWYDWFRLMHWLNMAIYLHGFGFCSNGVTTFCFGRLTCLLICHHQNLLFLILLRAVLLWIKGVRSFVENPWNQYLSANVRSDRFPLNHRLLDLEVLRYFQILGLI